MRRTTICGDMFSPSFGVGEVEGMMDVDLHLWRMFVDVEFN